MSAERTRLHPAYVLHSRPYRDSSLLLEVCTAEQGRVSLVARGARRRARGGSDVSRLQVFTPLLLSFSGRHDLKTLTGVEQAGPAWQLRGKRLYSGLYLNELLVRLLHRYDPHPRLFAAYSEALELLAGTFSLDELLRSFELTLLDELGYSFRFDVDAASGEPVTENDHYRYEPGHGLVRLAVAEEPPGGCYAGTDLLQMARGKLGGATRDASKRLLREALAVHLGDQPLRSRELFGAARGKTRRMDSGAGT